MNLKLDSLKYGLSIFLILISTAVFAQNKKFPGADILPKKISSKVYFGMDLERFKKKLGADVKLSSTSESFRSIYSQQVNSNEIKEIVYYFDKDDKQALYEIIISYQKGENPEEIAKRLFGEANFKGDEWRVEEKENLIVWSWVFMNKLILVGNIPNTEWSSEFDD